MRFTDERKRSGGHPSAEAKSAKVSLSDATLYSAKTGRALAPAIARIHAVAVAPAALAVTLTTGICVVARPSELLDQRRFRRLAKAQGVMLPRIPHGVWHMQVRRAVSQNRGR